MSSSLPVPSKAALTALRGLLVGTSCTLVLISEDRRRRINAARRVLDNADKLRSNKRYYAGGSAVVIALEEEALLEQDLMPWTMRPGPEHRLSQTSALSGSPHPPPGQLLGVRDIKRLLAASAAPRGPPNVEPLPVVAQHVQPAALDRDGPYQALPQTAVVAMRKAEKLVPRTVLAVSAGLESLTTTPGGSGTFSRIRELCESGAFKDVKEAVKLFRQYMFREEGLAPEDRESCVAASTLLCETCLAMGQTQVAARVLRIVIANGPMDESDYYHHNPLGIIDSILPRQLSDVAVTSDDVETLELAIDLFVPQFLSEPKVADPRLVTTGKQLLERAFALGRLERVDAIFRRIIAHNEGDYDFIQWHITNLHRKDEHWPVIQLFRLFYAKKGPRNESYRKVVDLVVDSVTAAYGYKAEQVLKILVTEDVKLETTWVIRLLSAHWKRYSSLSKTAFVFAAFEERLDQLVYHPSGVYRVMMEIALEGGDHLQAKHYFSKLVEKDSSFGSDVRLLGLFALANARTGRWEAVHGDFTAMRTDNRADMLARGQVFVPVLKEHIRQHTTGETEEFLKRYIEAEHVPVTRYMVGLMARQYGVKRDVKSFIHWLEYCAKSRFQVDAAFSNAILTACRQRWDFSSIEMGQVLRKLRSLNRNFANDDSGRIVFQAAVSSGRSTSAFPIAQRSRGWHLQSYASDSLGRCAREENGVLAMSEAIIADDPGRAIDIYKRAARLGMPRGRGLHLAVLACVQRDGPMRCLEAMALLRKAQHHGQDVSIAAGPLLDACLSNVDVEGGGETVLREVKAVLQRFQQERIELNDYALNRVALFCLRKRHFRGAVHFALAASQANGQPRTACYNVFNFGVLLPAYLALLDTTAVISAVSLALSSDYVCHRLCLKTLKVASRRLRQTGLKTAEVLEAQAAVAGGIATVAEQRRRLRAEKDEVSTEVMRIMAEAALHAGQNPVVDEERLSWTGEQDGGAGRIGRRKDGQQSLSRPNDVSLEELHVGENHVQLQAPDLRALVAAG